MSQFQKTQKLHGMTLPLNSKVFLITEKNEKQSDFTIKNT